MFEIYNLDFSLENTVGVVACNSTIRKTRQEEHEFKASLSHLVKPCLNPSPSK
jgi:hypothetical protein